MARVIKPGGVLIANFPDENNAVLANAHRQSDGSLTISNDPFAIRNGIRFMAASGRDDVAKLLAPDFKIIAVGHQDDDYFGLRVSGYFAVAERA
jgi:hypothetical protein